MVEVDTGVKQDYEYKLTRALQDLRKEHEEQVNLYKTELEQTFLAKVLLSVIFFYDLMNSTLKLSCLVSLQLSCWTC